MSLGCEFLITRGKRKGTPCGAKAGCGDRCRAHQVKRPLVAAPKNLFFDVLPTDLQDYIVKMPLVEEILKYQQVLARYQYLEFVRKKYFNPLNQMYRQPLQKPYKAQTLLNHWCKALREPLQSWRNAVHMHFGEFVSLLTKREPMTEEQLRSKLDHRFDHMCAMHDVWLADIATNLEAMRLANGVYADWPAQDMPTIATAPVQDLPDDADFDMLCAVDQAVLTMWLHEQRQLVQLYYCAETQSFKNDIERSVVDAHHEVFLLHSLKELMSWGFLIKRKCDIKGCCEFTKTKRGICARCCALR